MNRVVSLFCIALILLFGFATVYHFHGDGVLHAGCSICAAQHQSAAPANDIPPLCQYLAGLSIFSEVSFFVPYPISLSKDWRAPPSSFSA